MCPKPHSQEVASASQDPRSPSPSCSPVCDREGRLSVATELRAELNLEAASPDRHPPTPSL